MLLTNLNKVRRLSWNDRSLLFQAVLLLPVIHVALLLLGYARLRRIMERSAPLLSTANSVRETDALAYAHETGSIVSIASEHGFYKATCLRRSLLLWWLMRLEGIESQICFGVRMLDGRLEAHAWVEYNGMVLNDSADVYRGYHALKESLPGTRRGL